MLKLHQEALEVSRRERVTGRVTVSTVTRPHEEHIDELLTSEHVEIERREVGQLVETAPAVRQEGDVTIIPVVEEVVVVEKRLILKEEVHVRRVRTTERHHESVTLREQDVVITRASEPQTSSPSSG